MENKETSNSHKLKNAICYIPVWAIVLFFTEQKKSEELMKHIKYGTFLFVAYIILRFIIVWVLMINLSWILFLVYAWITGFFWFKAYNGEDVDIDYIDDFEKKVKDNLEDK